MAFCMSPWSPPQIIKKIIFHCGGFAAMKNIFFLFFCLAGGGFCRFFHLRSAKGHISLQSGQTCKNGGAPWKQEARKRLCGGGGTTQTLPLEVNQLESASQSGMTRVPVSPRSARAMFSGLVMMASLPPASRNQMMA